ncbi:MAG: rod shape-determining protein RodA [Rhodospirillales bacterium]
MRAPEMSLGEKLWQVNWGLVLLLTMIAGIGFAVLYSAAGGRVDPWALKHIIRFGVTILIMLAIALIDIRVWLQLAYPIYFAVLMLLAAVDVMGAIGMGAQRWLDLYVIQLQPSELMKIAMVLALARYYHNLNVENIGRVRHVIPPVLIVLVPVALVMKQPDLGTALMLVFAGGAIMFAAGVRIWMLLVAIVGAGAALPVAWGMLRDYQKHRLLTFLNPENDPLGTGYHITQSKIALGSGGLFGKGFMAGTQGHLNFLPEKQTDFIFTMFAEEFGLVGGIVLLALFVLVLLYGFAIALRSRSHFGRILALGISITIFLYLFINIGMVMGVLPVVGVPLPLVSYGGTAMLSVLAGCGLLISVYVHRDVIITRAGGNT